MSSWATSALPSSSSRPGSIYICTTATSPKITRRIFSLAISPQRPPPRTHANHPKHTIPGKSLRATSNSNAKHHSHSHSSELPDDSTGQKRPLSGSDVLRALRRAAAHKSKKKNKDVSFISAGPNIGLDNPAADYTNVLPLSIKTEWGTRLKQIEQRLQQLMDA